MQAWSYSSLSTFKQCPKKYYHIKVAKDVEDKGNEATIYGNELHKAAECYIKSNTPLESIKSALLYVVSNDLIEKNHEALLRKSYFSTFDPELERLQTAEETGVWNAVSGPLCGWCPVKACEHWRERR